MNGLVFVSKVKLLCSNNHIKMADFYRECGVTSGAMSQWKSGLTKPSIQTVERIADFLGVSVSYLMDDKSSLVLQAPAQTGSQMSDKDREIAEYLQEIRDDPNKRMMFDLAKDATIEEIKATVAFLELLKGKRTEE